MLTKVCLILISLMIAVAGQATEFNKKTLPVLILLNAMPNRLAYSMSNNEKPQYKLGWEYQVALDGSEEQYDFSKNRLPIRLSVQGKQWRLAVGYRYVDRLVFVGMNLEAGLNYVSLSPEIAWRFCAMDRNDYPYEALCGSLAYEFGQNLLQLDEPSSHSISLSFHMF